VHLLYESNHLEKEYRNISKCVKNQPVFSLIVCTHA